MVFKEIEIAPEVVRFNEKNGNITIAVSLIRRYWTSNGLTHVQVFHDEENKKVGFKPSKEGYKLFLCGKAWRICVRPLTKTVDGKFKAEWNEKHGMLIIDYGKERTD